MFSLVGSSHSVGVLWFVVWLEQTLINGRWC